MKADPGNKMPVFLLAAVLAAVSIAPTEARSLEGPDGDPPQLIVLLRHGEGAPTPEAVVEAARRGDPLPAGLGVGGPTQADFVISPRSRGTAEEDHRLDPEEPAAKLRRYIVLSYPKAADFDAISLALEVNPHVAWVGPVRYAEISTVEPNDPRFAEDPDGDGIPRPAEEHQWGSYALGLPAAWEYTKGHAYVGVLDTGIDADHEDLQALDASNNFLGGNFRPHLSWDYQSDSAVVDDGLAINNHGTHVSGIVGATANNGKGVAGACWHCAVVMSQVSNDGLIPETALEKAIYGSADRGMQVLNMSFGFEPGKNPPDCAVDTNDPLCVALQLAENREMVIAAAAGNDATSEADWPAIDPRVLGAGGIEPDGSFWDEDCTGSEGCGSNADPDQLVTPAKAIFSTFYDGVLSPSPVCNDDLDGERDGYGPCTGTSMASPYLAASAGILRSINPLLAPDEIRALLVDNVENPPTWDPADGIGKPNVHEAALDTLGRVGGTVIDNRLTPLFQLYAFEAEDHIYTTSPQMGSALTRGDFYKTDGGAQDYWPTGPDVPGYDYFPGGNCLFVACPARASVYIFTGDRSPNGHPLVPLYRLSFDEPWGGNPDNRDHTYTTEAAGIKAFADVGYRLDGVEGYIYERCSPEPSCIPAGAVRLYRYYNATRDDWAIFPESELSTWESNGYEPQSGANPWIGYVYENVDSDADWLIDGFETLIGTDPNTADSDCDGAHDGQELFKDYPYGDPLDGTCSSIVGEVGQVTDLRHVSQTVVLSRSYTNPVVIAQPPSYNGAHQSVVRISDVQIDRFTFRIEEAPNLDGGHTFETVSYLVLEAGSWQLPDGTEIEVGKVSTSATVGRNLAGSFATVTFSQAFATAPVVMTQIQTVNDPSWAKTRQLLASTSSFKVALEEEEASTTAHGTETIGWVAVTPGTGVWSGHRFQAANTPNSVTDTFYSIAFGQGFASAPRFLAAMGTRDGADNSALRYRNLAATGVEVRVEEDTTFDTEVGHTTEVASYLTLQGDGTLAASPR